MNPGYASYCKSSNDDYKQIPTSPYYNFITQVFQCDFRIHELIINGGNSGLKFNKSHTNVKSVTFINQLYNFYFKINFIFWKNTVIHLIY